MRMMQLIAVAGIVAALAIFPGSEANAGKESVRYSRKKISRATVHIVTVNLNDPRIEVRPVVAGNQVGRRQSFTGFLARHQPLAQLTGSYFGLRNSLPVGDLVIRGRRLYDGHVGSALALRQDNTARIIDIPHRWKSSWHGYENVLQGGIRLVENGKTAVYPTSQGFYSRDLLRATTRTAVGLTRHRKLLLVAVENNVQLSRLAGIMKALGCVDAMTLDGGTSTGIAFGHRVLVQPGRTISNVLQVVERPRPVYPKKARVKKQVKAVPPATPTFPLPAKPAPKASPDAMMTPRKPAAMPALPTAPERLTENSYEIWFGNRTLLANPPRFRYSKKSEASSQQSADDRFVLFDRFVRYS